MLWAMVSKDPSKTHQASLILSSYLEQRHKDLACILQTPILIAMADIINQLQHYFPWSPMISSQSSNHNSTDPPLISQN